MKNENVLTSRATFQGLPVVFILKTSYNTKISYGITALSQVSRRLINISAVPYRTRLIAGFPPAQQGFSPKSGHLGVVAEKAELGRFFPDYFGSPRSSPSTVCFVFINRLTIDATHSRY
jgi:hypothetical protein